MNAQFMMLCQTAQAPDGMLERARSYAARWGWQFRQLTERPDLFNQPSWRALFVDRAGVEHERTVDDLTAAGKPAKETR